MVVKAEASLLLLRKGTTFKVNAVIKQLRLLAQTLQFFIWVKFEHRSPDS